MYFWQTESVAFRAAEVAQEGQFQLIFPISMCQESSMCLPTGEGAEVQVVVGGSGSFTTSGTKCQN